MIESRLEHANHYLSVADAQQAIANIHQQNDRTYIQATMPMLTQPLLCSGKWSLDTGNNLLICDACDQSMLLTPFTKPQQLLLTALLSVLPHVKACP